MKRVLCITSTVSEEVTLALKKIDEKRVSLLLLLQGEIQAKMPGQYKPFLILQLENRRTNVLQFLAELILTDYGSSLYKNDQTEYLPGNVMLLTEDQLENIGIDARFEALPKTLTAIGTHLNLNIILIRKECGVSTIGVKNIWI